MKSNPRWLHVVLQSKMDVVFDRGPREIVSCRLKRCRRCSKVSPGGAVKCDAVTGSSGVLAGVGGCSGS